MIRMDRQLQGDGKIRRAALFIFLLFYHYIYTYLYIMLKVLITHCFKAMHSNGAIMNAGIHSSEWKKSSDNATVFME